MQKQKTERPTIRQIESGEREAKFGLGSTHPFDEQMGLPGTLESDPKIRKVGTLKSRGSIFDGLKERGKKREENK